ncbi:Chromatin assembly factor 1 subunit A-like protein [Elsinoe fawcettii]|nr:Chromatin assembly factor 1 subunit A-like protein [Elsinoe fawcettii]
MDIDTVTTPPSNPLKRTLADLTDKPNHSLSAASEHSMPTPPQSSSEDGGTVGDSPSKRSREPSPAPSTSTLSSIPTSTAGSNAAGPQAAVLNGTVDRPAKRRKLTPAEKLQQAHEKAEKQRQREERKAQKEAEAAVRAEERRVKNEEKEVKQRERDIAKQQKEEEKRKKDEEIAKKQRNQLRLGNFFAKSSPAKPKQEDAEDINGIASQGAKEPEFASPSDSHSAAETSRKRNPNFDRYFLPFSLPQHTVLAPIVPPGLDVEGALSRFDHSVSRAHSTNQPPTLRSLFGSATSRLNLPPLASSVHGLVAGTSSHPVDLTSALGPTIDQQLTAITIKHIQFSEDVRPPYTGSYTQVTNDQKAKAVTRMPLRRVRPDTNYDYDSEAEWEEPEDGEDVLSDEEEDAESVGSADEMDEFLDDGEDTMVARRKLEGGEQPVSSGLCWEDTAAKRSQGQSDGPFDLSTMRLQFILPDDTIRSVDPFSDRYWVTQASASKRACTVPIPQRDLFGNPITVAEGGMKPPRAPLQPSSNGPNLKALNSTPATKGPIMKAEKSKAAKLVGADFDMLRDAIIGSDVGKVDLLKALKQRFPKFTNDSIKETVVDSFERVGEKGNKAWQLK